MGWIEQRGNSFRARWTVNGERVSVVCATKAEAQDVLDEVARSRRRGTYIDPRGGQLTVEQWANAWIDARPHLKPSSDATDRGRMANHIVGKLGTLRLEQVTPLVVRRWVTELGRTGLAAKTVRNCHGLLHSLMQAAVDERLIPSNPCTGSRLPSAASAEMHFLAAGQIDQLVAATVEHYRPLVITLVGTGLRWGEAAGLRRRRVDLSARRLEVAETLQEVNGRLSFGTPKTKASRRIVTLPEVVVDALTPLSKGDADQPIFTTETGSLLRRRNFSRRIWHPAIAKANEDEDDPVLPSKLRVHDLRHTHVAQLIAAGVPPTAIQRRLGHSSIAITSDVYGHLLPEVDERLLDAIDEALSGLRAPILPPRTKQQATKDQ